MKLFDRDLVAGNVDHVGDAALVLQIEEVGIVLADLLQLASFRSAASG